MSSYIACKLEIKNIETLKKVLDEMGLVYQDGKTQNIVGRMKDVEIFVPRSELRKIDAGMYNDMGFRYNDKTENYEVILDSYDQHLSGTINKLYALETLKAFAIENRKSYEIISGVDDIYSSEEIILEIYN